MPAQNEWLRLRSDEVLNEGMNQGCLIVTPTVQTRFLLLDCYSPTPKIFGDAELIAPTGQTMQVVEEAARVCVEDWVKLKMGVIDMQAWEVRAQECCLAGI